MTEPVKLSEAVDGARTAATVKRPSYCSAKDCPDDCEVVRSSGEHVEIRHGMRMGLCKMHGEMEYSARWQRRFAEARGDAAAEMRLYQERDLWVSKGHLYRGTADRAYVDRRAGVD